MGLEILKGFIWVVLLMNLATNVLCMSKNEKLSLKNKAIDMFDHAFSSYMTYGFPADEVMPISCKGRFRSLTKSRGDIDEVLGNYSLTLVDSLDTLALLGKIDEFETGVRNVLKHTHFDRDIIVSVFESNIRMLGGLLGAHVSLLYLREKQFPKRFEWYTDDLLKLAKDLGNRLLPAFNTSSGLPMSRVNLKYGLTNEILYNEKDRFTCTACAGTLLLEFATLSRLTNEPVFEEKARQALKIIWDNRNRMSDLVGTVINVENSEWVVKDSNIGAGIDSYYEYLFKGYVLLNDNELLDRFNRHYNSLLKYTTLNSHDGMTVGDGSFMKTVHMHMPTRQAKSYIDSLLAFWPGLQVMKGDIKGAIKMHETLYQIVKKHGFLPEAVLFDHSAHWVSHPLRPEFLESTYFLYKATNDDYYLEIAKKALNHLEDHCRVSCGYAAINDVRTKSNEDRMDSFVLAETFKYFFLIFAEDKDIIFNLDEFIFTTEAHLMPINLKMYAGNFKKPTRTGDVQKYYTEMNSLETSCPSLSYQFSSKEMPKAIKSFRDSVTQNSPDCEQKPSFIQRDEYVHNARNMPLRAVDFVAGRKEHMEILAKMGIQLVTMKDGRVQLVHKTNQAESLEDAEIGILFMTEMLELSKQQNFQMKSNFFIDEYRPMSLVLLSEPFNGSKEFYAGSAQFGFNLKNNNGVFGKLLYAEPADACTTLSLPENIDITSRIVVAKRGNCIFINKARIVQNLGALGLIIIDNSMDTSYTSAPLFSMSGDGLSDVDVPSIFLFGKEGKELLWEMRSNPELIVFMGDNLKSPSKERIGMSGVEITLNHKTNQLKEIVKPEKICHRFYFKDFARKKENCLVKDYNLLGSFYNIFKEPKKTQSSSSKKIDSSDSENVIVFDESIHLVFSDTDKYIEINLNALTESQAPPQTEIEADIFAQRIFELLNDRFEQNTNILKLNNHRVYTQALLNFVYSKLNVNSKAHNFTENDKYFIKSLAQELDHNVESSNTLSIISRKKVPRASNDGN